MQLVTLYIYKKLYSMEYAWTSWVKISEAIFSGSQYSPNKSKVVKRRSNFSSGLNFAKVSELN